MSAACVSCPPPKGKGALHSQCLLECLQVTCIFRVKAAVQRTVAADRRCDALVERGERTNVSCCVVQLHGCTCMDANALTYMARRLRRSGRARPQDLRLEESKHMVTERLYLPKRRVYEPEATTRHR